MKRLKRFPYWDWEDYVAGLYKMEWGRDRTTAHAIAILGNADDLREGMNKAVQQWPRAASHHLTDGGQNQRAWLGWAACGILDNIPAHVTRAAWWMLSEDERKAANDVADEVIAAYYRPGDQVPIQWGQKWI